MKKILIIIAAMAACFGADAQGKYFTRDGHIKFFSSTPIEDIEADNHKVTVVLDEATGKLEFAAVIKSFEFEKALMQEHFNENYMESKTYPKATFKGEVKDFADQSFDSDTEVLAVGQLSMHRVTNDVEIPGTIKKGSEGYTLTSKFMVKPEDYKIEIPNTVRDKIAKEVEVTVDCNLAPLKK